MDVTPGVTKLADALPGLVQTLMQGVNTDEASALAAFQSEVTQILNVENTAVSRILAEAQAFRLELARTNDLIQAFSQAKVPEIPPRAT